MDMVKTPHSFIRNTRSQRQIWESQEALNQNSQPLPPQPKANTGRPIPHCIYCKGTSHRSIECRKVPEAERKVFLVRNQSCTNCGRANHRATYSRGEACRRCSQKYHSSYPCRGSQPNAIPITHQTQTRSFVPREQPRPQQTYATTTQTPTKYETSQKRRYVAKHTPTGISKRYLCGRATAKNRGE